METGAKSYRRHQKSDELFLCVLIQAIELDNAIRQFGNIMAESTNKYKLNKTQRIEKGTAEMFLNVYNNSFGCDFAIERLGEQGNGEPDIICKNLKTGEKLSLEVTCLEDVYSDTGYRLGHLKDKPMSKSGLTGRSFYFDTLPRIFERLSDKCQKRFGANVALVLRQVSGIPWDFELELGRIRALIDLRNNPYDKGIWILSIQREIFRIDS